MTSHRSSPRPHLPHLAWIVSALVLISLLGVPATSAPPAPALTLYSPAPGALHLTWPAVTPAPPAYHVQYAPADTPTLIEQATSPTPSLTLYDLEPGVVYTVQVRAGVGPWSVPVLQRIDDYRADPETVGTIGVGAEETGYIESAGDADWFFVDLAAGEGYPIEVTGAPAPPLAVYEATGGVVQQGLAWHHASALTFTPATAGLYHVAVGGPAAEPGHYTLTVDEPPSAGPRRTRTLAGATPKAAPEPRRSTAKPAKPKGLSATASHDRVILTWNDPNDASITGYVILRRVRENDTGGAFSVLVADTGSAAPTYTDATVSANTTYTYRIKAINAYGVSKRSRWFHIDTPAAPEAVEGDAQDGEDDDGGAPGHATPPGPGGRANVSEGDTDLPASTATTGEVDVGGSVTGTIGTADDRDWFTVELVADTKYEIAVTGLFTDAIKAIFNAPSRTPNYSYNTSTQPRYSLHAPAVTVRDSTGAYEVGRASTVISSSDPCRPLYLENWDPIVEFTPDEAGTYSIEVASLGSGNYWRRGPPDNDRRCHSRNVQFDATGTYEMSVREWPPHISKGPTAISMPGYWFWTPHGKPKFREPVPAHEAYTGAYRPPGEAAKTHSPNTYGRGETIEFRMEFTEAVTVTGVPELNLRGGATGDRHRGSGDRWSKYLSGSGTNTLVFSYTVESGDYDERGFRTGDWWSGSKLTWRLRGDAAITSVATGSHAVLEAYVGHAYPENGLVNGRVTTPAP